MHRAKKRFGQNFLHDRNIINRIVQSISPSAEDHLVEIGPGQGAITQELLKIAGKLEAVELDRDLLQPLAERCANLGRLQIYNSDALSFDFRQLVSEENPKPLRLVGNLPYNISTPLLFHLLEQADSIQDMHFMLQKEVVDRMAAKPGSKTYGRLSVMLQAWCKVEPLFDIGPGAFHPAPKVDSGFVRLTPYTTPLYHIKDQRLFSQIVTQAFSQRRKTLRNSLKKMLDDTVFEQAGIDPSLRAERISLEEFVNLADKAWKTGQMS
ncbi:MAG: 16S rRNA (adenine(1518)-N(6)/adenine(1519)-N(6))-dimethyltransferase RsmA [Chromatiales bacterium]|nr:16S rRNA (adenine(1518)-N(6)/adenine(1519)-N(6))-dimethyltransferase RsmA [Chromatiales bacterium]